MTSSRYSFLLFFLTFCQLVHADVETTPRDEGRVETGVLPLTNDYRHGADVQTLEVFQVTLEKLIKKAYSDSQFFFCCDLMRLYIQRFPNSRKNDLYLSGFNNAEPSLVEIKSTLLARGRDSLAKANSADQRLIKYLLQRTRQDRPGSSQKQVLYNEALRLARGDQTLANDYLAKYDVAVGGYLEAAVYLSSHCLIFPNSKDNSQILGDAAKSAEIAGLPMLEMEMRLRLLNQNSRKVDFSFTEILSEKARRQSRYFVGINVLDRFIKQDYSHPKAGAGFISSGDIHQLAGCYEAAVTKYNQALLWCGDMRRINYSENDDSDSFTQEVVAVQRSANLSIGYALLSEAKGKHLRESTAVFAGKLHDQSIAKFENLVNSVESGSPESLDFLLGLVRARVESARYKQSHSSVLGGNEIEDAYATCIPVCESYLRVVDQGLTGGQKAFSPIINQDRHEVAFVLMEALFAINKPESVEGQFFKDFMNPADGESSKWQALAKAKIAERLIGNDDYLMAYPLLSEVVQEARKTGLRDVGFVAALMKGICISKLDPAVNSLPASGSAHIGEGKAVTPVSSVQLVRDEYVNALSILNDPSIENSINYPIEFRGLFQESIRDELVAEFRNEFKDLERGWDPFGLSDRKALLIEALSNVNPEKTPFNPNSLIVTAFLRAQR